MLTQLIQRDLGEGIRGYYHAFKGDKKYSVVDFSTTMKSMPFLDKMKKAGLFMGWEAMELVNDDLDGYPIRANSWEELEKKL